MTDWGVASLRGVTPGTTKLDSWTTSVALAHGLSTQIRRKKLGVEKMRCRSVARAEMICFPSYDLDWKDVSDDSLQPLVQVRLMSYLCQSASGNTQLIKLFIVSNHVRQQRRTRLLELRAGNPTHFRQRCISKTVVP